MKIINNFMDKEDLKIRIVSATGGFNILVKSGDKEKLIHVGGCGFDKLIENLGEYVGVAIKEFNQSNKNNN